MLEIPPDIAAQTIAESEKVALAAIERFDAAARRQPGFRGAPPVQDDRGGSPRNSVDVHQALRSQRVHAIRPNGVDNDDMIETSLFESGRPLMVVSYIQKDGLKLDHVVCCWDGSRAAARAFNDALPLLDRYRTAARHA
jgi:hypothetical protein